MMSPPRTCYWVPRKYTPLYKSHDIIGVILCYIKNILTFLHGSFTFNSNKSPTCCNNFSVYYPDVCLQLNMFRVFSRPLSGAQWLQWQPLVLPSYRGDSRAVVRVRAGRSDHDQQHCYHQAPTVNQRLLLQLL